MAQPLALTRLELDTFSDKARMHVDPSSPVPMRMMGAKAMAPLPPTEMVSVLYQLTHDPENTIREAARASLKGLPSEILSGVAGAPLDPRVLDNVARTVGQQDAVLQPLVLNPKLANETLVFLAERVSERVSEIIAGNHQRLLACPAIIEALYVNPNARMSTIDKLVDLAARNQVKLVGLPGLEEAMKAPDYQANKDSAVTDDAFAALAAESIQRDDVEPDEALDALIDGEREAENEQEVKRQSRWQLIESMSPSQKIRLAVLGNKEDRAILLRDSRKIVHMAAIQSPKITPGEAAKLAGNRSLPDGVVAYIAKRREWTRFYPVVVSLVNNPKTPVSASMVFLKQLRSNDLSNLRRNKNVPSQVARQASAMHRQKSGGGGD